MLFLLTATVAVVLVAVFAYLPWASRLAALYLLHGLRDRLYSVGCTDLARSTLLYRDIEYILCIAINRVRGSDLRAAFTLLAAFDPSRRTPSRDDARVYDASARTLGPQLDELLGVLTPLPIILVGFVVMQRPQLLVVVAIGVPYIVAYAVVRGITDGLAGPLARLSRAVNTSVSRPQLATA